MNKKLKILLHSIGNPLINDGEPISPVESKEILDLAFKNNVELEYLEKLKSKNLLNILQKDYDIFNKRLAETARCIKRITTVLDKKDIPYALTKTIRPYPGIPNDSDILYLGELKDYSKAVDLLVEEGFERCGGSDMQAQLFDPKGGDTFKRDKRGGRFYIDFYRQLAADHVPYMDSKLIRDHVIRKKHTDFSVNIFNPHAEICILFLHSVIMHRTLPFEVVLTISYYLKSFADKDYDELIKFFKKNHLMYVAKYMFIIFCYLFTRYYNVIPNEVRIICSKLGIKIDKIDFNKYNYDNYPYIIELKVFFIALFEKTLDSNSLKGMFIQFRNMLLNPRFFVEVLYHIFSKKRTIAHSCHV